MSFMDRVKNILPGFSGASGASEDHMDYGDDSILGADASVSIPDEAKAYIQEEKPVSSGPAHQEDGVHFV
mgnify:CR=1 FL=1|tara:strand:- start:11199 stop:11408 length:210 start_codon:yes stop_codon:yes gene_type:complete